MGLGCGDPSQIQIVGDQDAAAQNWNFVGPMQNLTFAAKMQHRIYWGSLKELVEWSLKTWMAPWSYIASVLYHDFYWYPNRGKKHLRHALESQWGQLFANWEEMTANQEGWDFYPPGKTKLTAVIEPGGKFAKKLLGILAHTVKEAPEVSNLLRRKKHFRDK